MHSESIDPRLGGLGWTPFFHQQFLALIAEKPEWAHYEPQRIVADRGSEYALQGPSGPKRGVLAGRLLRELTEDARPCVGDFVLTGPATTDPLVRIEHVFERSSCFRRKAAGETSFGQAIAANVDVAIVVCALSAEGVDPHARSHALNPARLTRYLQAIRAAPARPLIVVNKADLNPDAEAEAARLARTLNVDDVIAVSALSGQGFERLSTELGPGLTGVVVGSSGVGKSSLINTWLGRSAQKTSAVRESDTRGRHTTTHRELFALTSGGLLIDTPGMREFGLMAGEEQDLTASFDDIDHFAQSCRFRDCTHTNEPGCGVRAAVERGELDSERLKQAHKLSRELHAQRARQDAFARLSERRQNRVRSRAARVGQRLKDR